MTQSKNLVGRAAERRVLAQVLDAARSGSTGIVQIVGEPGIGKTRLLGHLHDLARDSGFTVLHCRGTEFDHDVPYGAVSDLLEIRPAHAPDKCLDVAFASTAEGARVQQYTCVRQTNELFTAVSS